MSVTRAYDAYWAVRTASGRPPRPFAERSETVKVLWHWAYDAAKKSARDLEGAAADAYRAFCSEDGRSALAPIAWSALSPRVQRRWRAFAEAARS